MEVIRNLFDGLFQSVAGFFNGFYPGSASFSGQEYLIAPSNPSWLWTFFGFCTAYLVLFVLLPLFTWSRYLKGKSAIFRFWFALITQTFFVVNTVLLLSLIKICNVFTFALALLAYTFLIHFHGRWHEVLHRGKDRKDTYVKLFTGRYGLRLLVRNDRQAFFPWLGTKLAAFGKHVLRHLPEYLMLIAVLAANLWFYSYGSMHYNSYGFGDEYTHSGWIYQITQGNVFSNGIYPFAMHCKIYALHTLSGIGLHESVLYFGIMETMMMLVGLYTLVRTLCRRKYCGIIAVIFASFASYAPILVIRRFQWSLPEECAVYLVFPVVFFFIRWLRDDVMPMPARKTGPLKFVRSCFNRKFFTDNLILFALSASLVVATHFYTAIIAVLFCVIVGMVYFSKIILENRLFPLMVAVLGAMTATVFPFLLALIEGKPFEASIEWALNVAGTSAGSGIPPVLYLAAFVAVVVMVLLVTLFSWGMAQLDSKRRKERVVVSKIASSVIGLFLAALCCYVFFRAEELGLNKLLVVLKGNILSTGLLGYSWGRLMILVTGVLVAMSVIAWIFGHSERAKGSIALAIVYFAIAVLYCLPNLGFPQLMDQVRVSVFAVVFTPVILTVTLDYFLAFPIPWFIRDPIVAHREKKRAAKVSAAPEPDGDSASAQGAEAVQGEDAQGVMSAQGAENAGPVAAIAPSAAPFRVYRQAMEQHSGKREKKKVTRGDVFRIVRRITGGIVMTAICVSVAALLYCGGQFHSLTEMEFTQYNAATDCARSIMANYQDFSWTIVSPTDELYQVNQHGYHEEIVNMINEIDYKEYYTIPSEYLFFFVEKNVLNYAQTLTYPNGKIMSKPVTEEASKKNFVLSNSFTANYTINRQIVMSKMYYWAQAFRMRYPNEIKVYYEDDDFVCYRIHQNTYSLYNLDINYGYVRTYEN